VVKQRNALETVARPTYGK